MSKNLWEENPKLLVGRVIYENKNPKYFCIGHTTRNTLVFYDLKKVKDSERLSEIKVEQLARIDNKSIKEPWSVITPNELNYSKYYALVKGYCVGQSEITSKEKLLYGAIVTKIK